MKVSETYVVYSENDGIVSVHFSEEEANTELLIQRDLLISTDLKNITDINTINQILNYQLKVLTLSSAINYLEGKAYESGRCDGAEDDSY